MTRGVLRLPVHASYPFLIEVKGSNRNAFTASRNRRGRRCGCTALDSRKWERVCTLEGVKAAGFVEIVEFEGRWWMFYGVTGASGAVELHAAYSARLEGTWQRHAGNPLRVDVRSSRPGGTPFVHEGKLYRPGQDCSRTYGGAVSIMRVTRLTPTEFAEELVTSVQPDPRGAYPDGLHTISAVGDRTVIDGKRFVFVPVVFWNEVRKMARRLVGRLGGGSARG